MTQPYDENEGDELRDLIGEDARSPLSFDENELEEQEVQEGLDAAADSLEADIPLTFEPFAVRAEDEGEPEVPGPADAAEAEFEGDASIDPEVEDQIADRSTDGAYLPQGEDVTEGLAADAAIERGATVDPEAEALIAAAAQDEEAAAAAAEDAADVEAEAADEAEAEIEDLAEEVVDEAEEIADAAATTEDVLEAVAEEADPLAEFREKLHNQFGDWYVVHTYSGMEKRVKSNLENRITSLNAEDFIFEVVVPTEEVAEIKNGQRKLVKRTVLPGYVLVRMDLTDESWGVVRHTPSVTGFVGNSHQPVPLSLAEVESMLAPAVEAEVAVEKPAPPSTAAVEGRQGRVHRLRRRRLGHGRRRTVRDAARDHHRDQRRRPAGQGPRRDLRSRDPGRAQLHPDPEGLAEQVRSQGFTQHQWEGRGRPTETIEKDPRNASQEENRSHRQGAAAGRYGQPGPARRYRARPPRRQHHGVLQGLQLGHRSHAWQRRPGRDHDLRGPHRSPSSPRRRRRLS